MFYCNTCANQKEWPITYFQSRGRCEICGQLSECNEVKSSDLPIKKPEKYMKSFFHLNQIDLSHIGATSCELRPIELHMNPSGSVFNEPTLAIVMKSPSGMNYFGQLSLKTLTECMYELGYKIESIS